MTPYPQSLNKSTRRGRPGQIAAAARALGVDRTHLSRVLAGERLSRRLMERYQNLPRDNAGKLILQAEKLEGAG